MQHIVLTRFNVSGVGIGEAPDEDWLKDRFDLFKTYTAPSLAQQSESSFTWFIFTDVDTPPWLLEGIREVAPTAVLIPMASWSKASVVDSINQIRTEEKLLTTRIDNDDAVGRRFVERVQDGASGASPGQFINLTFGLQLAGDRLYHRINRSSPFVSRLEGFDDIETVFAVGHHRAWKHPSGIKQIYCSPMWMQVIHGRNVANQVNGVRSRAKSAAEFDLDLNLAETGRASAIFEAMGGVGRMGGKVLRQSLRLAKSRDFRSR
jgi:hypothetical protein